MIKHGKNKTPEHRIWVGIRSRCRDINCRDYKYYGGRGIKVCKRWDEFINFLKDMGIRPTANHSIDRINNDGDYCPENCRWATISEQRNNRRTNTRILFLGETKTLSQWAKEFKISRKTISYRIKRNWSIAESILMPIMKHGHSRRLHGNKYLKEASYEI